jgi:hypothetical protein
MIIINNIDNLKQPGDLPGAQEKARRSRSVWDTLPILLRQSDLRQGLFWGT